MANKLNDKLLSISLFNNESLILWIESFRDEEELNYNTIDFFKAYIEYDSPTQINKYNTKVQIIIDALQQVGVNLKINAMGRCSLQPDKHLVNLTLNNMSTELKELIFDVAQTNTIDYMDPSVSKTLTKLRADGYDFNDNSIVLRLAQYGNVDGVKWFITTFKYEVSSPILRECITKLVDHSQDTVEEILIFLIKIAVISVDVYIEKNSSGETHIPLNWFNITFSDKILKLLMPHSRVLLGYEKSWLYECYAQFFAHEPSLITDFILTDFEWERLSYFIITHYALIENVIMEDTAPFISKLASCSSTMTNILISNSGWGGHESIIEDHPLIRDTFFL